MAEVPTNATLDIIQPGFIADVLVMEGVPGTDGTNGTNGTSFRGAAGAPAGGLGAVGDWYLNTSNGDVYEKTGASTWTLRFNSTGPQGVPGPGDVNGPASSVDSRFALFDSTTGKLLKQSSLLESDVATKAGDLSQFAATTSAQLRGVLSDETGTGVAVFATSPTLVTPALGTPSALVLTNATGLPQSGVTDLTTDLAAKAPLASPTFTGTVAGITSAMVGATPSTRTIINDTTTAHTVTASMADNIITRTNAGASTETIDGTGGSMVAIGQSFDIVNLGAGVVTLTPGTGTPTLTSSGPGLKLVQRASCTVIRIASNQYYCVGALTA